MGTNLIAGPKASYPFLAPFADFLSYLLVMPVSKGAWNQLWASVSPGAKSGLFYHPVGQLNKGSQYAQDEKQSEELWQWTEKELKEQGF